MQELGAIGVGKWFGRARQEKFLLLNQDTILRRNFIHRLVERLQLTDDLV